MERNQERVKERQRQYYIKNHEKKAQYDREYYEKNKEKIAERSKQYYEENFSRIQEYNKKKNTDPFYREKRRKYRETRKERDSFLWRKWKDNNKDKIANIKQRRYNRIRGLEYSLTDDEWNQAVQYFGNKCAYCGEEKELEREHFIPVSKGGGFTKDNIIPACTYCNTSKLNKCFFEWYFGFIYHSQEREEKLLKYLGYEPEKV